MLAQVNIFMLETRVPFFAEFSESRPQKKETKITHVCPSEHVLAILVKGGGVRESSKLVFGNDHEMIAKTF